MLNADVSTNVYNLLVHPMIEIDHDSVRSVTAKQNNKTRVLWQIGNQSAFTSLNTIVLVYIRATYS